MKIVVALAQMNLMLGKPPANWEHALEKIDVAKRRGAEIVVLPELWASAYDLEHAREHADVMSEGLFAEVTHSARTKEIAIVGSLLERAGDRVYNTATFVNTRGEQIAAYRKIHLVPMLDEDKYLSAGDEASVFNATDTEPPHRAALAVCYDLRFPELFRYFALSGAEMVFLPSEWPTRRIAHFRTLIRARAIENQMFVIATNRVGTSQGEEFGGYSAIVDPWGETVVGAADSEALVLGEIDLSIVEEVRARVPVFANRRPDVYQKLGQ